MGEGGRKGEGGAVGGCVWVEWRSACVWEFDVCRGDEASGRADAVLLYAGDGDYGGGGINPGVEELGDERVAERCEQDLDVCLCACMVLLYCTFTLR